MRLVFSICVLAIAAPVFCVATDIPATRPNATTAREMQQSVYHWDATPVGETAQLLTLFCTSQNSDVPVVAVLRDTLGDENPENDRVTYVWLLSYSRPNLGQRFLAAVPFFYWRVGKGSEIRGLPRHRSASGSHHARTSGAFRSWPRSISVDRARPHGYTGPRYLARLSHQHNR